MHLVSWISPQVSELAWQFIPRIHPGATQLDLLLSCTGAVSQEYQSVSLISVHPWLPSLLFTLFPLGLIPSHAEPCGPFLFGAEIPPWDHFLLLHFPHADSELGSCLSLDLRRDDFSQPLF